MCSAADFPPYAEPLEDSVDWMALRKIRDERTAAATPDERILGIPPRTGPHERWTDGTHWIDMLNRRAR